MHSAESVISERSQECGVSLDGRARGPGEDAKCALVRACRFLVQFMDTGN